MRKIALAVHEREDLAVDPRTPKETLISLAEDPERSVRAHLVLYNDHLPSEVVDILVRDRDPLIRKLLADRPDTSPSILRKLLDDSTYEIEEAVKRNPNLTMETLNDLWHGMSKFEIREMLGDINTPINVLKTVIEKSNNEDYIEKALWNPLLSDDNYLLKLIAEYPNKYQGNGAAIKLFTDSRTSKEVLNKAFEILLDEDYSDVVVNIALSDKIDLELVKLAYGLSTKVNKTIAKLPNLPDDFLLGIISKDTDPNVILSIINNPKLKNDSELASNVLEKITDEFGDDFFYKDLINSSWISAEDLYDLIFETKGSAGVSDYIRDLIDPKKLTELSKLRSVSVLRALALNRYTPDEVYNDLFKYPEIYGTLALQPRTSLSQLETIYEDVRVTRNENIIRYLIKHKNTSPEILEELSAITNDPTAIGNLCNNPKTPLNVIKSIIKYNSTARGAIFPLYSREDLTPEMYWDLYKSKYLDAHDVKALIENKSVPLDIIIDILNNPDWNTQLAIRKSILSNVNLPSEYKDKLVVEYKKEVSRRLKDEKSKIPSLDYEGITSRNVQPKINQDLELLQRLKGHLK